MTGYLLRYKCNWMRKMWPFTISSVLPATPRNNIGANGKKTEHRDQKGSCVFSSAPSLAHFSLFLRLTVLLILYPSRTLTERCVGLWSQRVLTLPTGQGCSFFFKCLLQPGPQHPDTLLITGGSPISPEPHLDRLHCFQMKHPTTASHWLNLMHAATSGARDSHSISRLHVRDLINLPKSLAFKSLSFVSHQSANHPTNWGWSSDTGCAFKPTNHIPTSGYIHEAES